MTVDEGVAMVAGKLDLHIRDAVENCRAILISHNATSIELERELEVQKIELAEWRAKTLADVRKWLERGGATLQ